MLVRRFGTLVCIIALVASSAMGFRIDIHEGITRDALKDVTILWQPPAPVSQALPSPQFTQNAINEIVEANRAKDACRPGEQDTNTSCTPSAFNALINTLNLSPVALLASLKGQYPQEHFDAEYIVEGNALLIAHRDKIREALLQKDFPTARKLLGGALHAIQDFYAHSNWVELHLPDFASQTVVLENRLAEGTVGGPSSFSSGSYPRLAGKQEYVCIDGSFLMNDLNADQSSKLVALLNQIPPAEAQIIQKTLDDFPLTTEYYGFPTDKPEVSMYLKCRHSWSTSVLGVQVAAHTGIDKDVPGAKYHDFARKLAYVHSMQFILRFLNDPELQKNPGVIAGFMGQPAILSLTPPEVNTGQDLPYLQVSGAQFTNWIGQTNTQPTVLWNGKALQTNFIDNTRLDAALDKSNLVQPGLVKISVQQQDVDSNGNVAGTLKSNVVTFTIDQVKVDCPGAIRPHTHDPTYMDVNANSWNDTGLTVKAGEKLDFRVLQPGLVVWRSGLLGSDVAPPQGDSRVNPGNTLLWVDPPMPINVAPVGALIGMIMDPQSTAALIEKPDGAKYVFIGAGGPLVQPMPASGKLYLGINDGAFYNNGGCFQVRLPLKR